jgi:isopentenyldiphosphate isomerase
MSNVVDIERVEVVDEAGEPIGVVTRAEMRAGNLRHRSVGVLVRRPGDRALLAHRRAGWKDVWPGFWDIAFGGVCAVGEAGDDAARRELAEEAGIAVAVDDLQYLGTDTFADDAVTVVGFLYEVEHAGPFTFADGEVEEVEWVAVADLPAWLEHHEIVPDTRAMALPLVGVGP